MKQLLRPMRALLPALLLVSLGTQAQNLNYAVAGAANVAGTYTDLGTNGTAITTANNDDANSAPQSIGFTFNYNGASFTQFVLNTNGFIRLGAVAPSGTALYPSQTTASIVDPLTSTSPANTNLILPFNQDLGPGNGAGGTEYRVATTGAMGSRICTIQWENVSDKAEGMAASQYANFSFQVKLYEGSNLIEFVYATATPSTGTPGARFPNVGIKGNGVNNGQTVLAVKSMSSAPWSAASFITGAYSSFTLNYRANVGPDAGRTFRFTPNSTTCAPVTGLSVGTITTTTANLNFTGPASAVSYVVTVTPQGGTSSTVTPAPTASPVSLTNLTPATTYTVSVVTNCGGGDISPEVTTTFSTRIPPATYASLPYNEDFEGPWINGLGTRDVPTANWRNVPVTGDNSWRREDDGFASAGWRYAANEMPTTAFPTPPYVIRFSTGAHSARFHSFGADPGERGSLFLYVNMSGVGTKTLSYDYINPTGQDSLAVYVSTDGGATFGQPVNVARTSPTFTTRNVTINSTSATTVIRFLATSDFGNDDIGMDNLRLRVITATRNEALAATVGLYPNPAHRAFMLTVPAGKLHNAAATLTNSLGQVVQQRQLNLPVTGGDVSFNVSNLAAGVYTLQLKTGSELVVKRVVVE